MLLAWLRGRSLARGLPAPVADSGGFRVDTFAGDEMQRWVFAAITPDIAALAGRIREPGRLIKACATPEALRAALPPRWQLHAPAFFMTAGDPVPAPALPHDYCVERECRDGVTAVRVLTRFGEIAASGHAAEQAGSFVYDRIVTAPAHRRRRLGQIVMATLRQAKREADARELLVATSEGQALYHAIGWRTLSPYATASLPA